MKLLCVTDPLTHPADDTTVAIYNRLPDDQRFEMYHLEASEVGPEDEIPVQRIPTPLSFQAFRVLPNGPRVMARFSDFDLVYGRADLPYPPGFLPGLICQEGRTRFVARPSGMLACARRSFYRAHADQFLPPGLMTRNLAEAVDFIARTGAVVAKTNKSYGGKGVSRIWRQGQRWWVQHGTGEGAPHASLEALCEALFARDPEEYEFVRYLPNVTAGDKRVLVVDGQIYGGFLRLAGDGAWINNLTKGGTVHAAIVAPGEARAIRATCGLYHERGLHTLGYDFLLGDSGAWLLSEINATSNIGGYHRLEVTSGRPVMTRLFDWLLDFASR